SPAWGFLPASPVAVDRSHFVVVPRFLARAASGSPESSSTVIPSTPGLPLLALTRCSACLQFSSSQTSSMSRSVPARLSGLRVAVSVAATPSAAFGASLLSPAGEASSPCAGRFFCRCPLMSRAAYLPFPLLPLRVPFGPSIIVSGLAYLFLRLSALECLTSLADCMIYFALC